MLSTRVLSRNLGRSILSLSLLAGLGAAGCSPQDFDEVVGDVGDTTSQPAGMAIPFEEFTDDVGTRATTESRIVIRTQQGYVSVFGHAPPAGVDFARQWVIFYAAGSKPTGGFDANILSITRAGDKVLAVTELVSPGSGCAVTTSLTSPHVLVKFAAQPGTTLAFGKQNSTHDCDVTNACAAVLCPVGDKCVLGDVICVRAPCPPRATCVPDPTVTRCGGIAGRPCPTGQTCVDDPGDSCDPNNGGADCGGICVMSPPPPRDPCDGVDCAAGSHCESHEVLCVTAPCPASVAECVSDVFCGGIAGIKCPGMGRCADDPGDMCDPAHGGADCGGICQCIQNVLCVAGAKFDPSPKVCACVPPPPTCGPVCDIFCQFGHVLDANGCPTCACNPPPKG
jgi:hypothetical protein